MDTEGFKTKKSFNPRMRYVYASKSATFRKNWGKNKKKAKDPNGKELWEWFGRVQSSFNSIEAWVKANRDEYTRLIGDATGRWTLIQKYYIPRLRQFNLQPRGLFQFMGTKKKQYLSVGHYTADKWNYKLFGMDSYKDKSWQDKNSDEQELLSALTNYNVKLLASPKKPVTPPSPARPGIGNYNENSPMPITFPDNTTDQFKTEYSQFFGTSVCMRASEPEYRKFLQREIYSIFAREALGPALPSRLHGSRQMVAGSFNSHLVLADHRFPSQDKFGVVLERNPGHRSRTNTWKAINAMFQDNKKNEAVWRNVVEHVKVKDPNHTALTESNFMEKYNAQYGAHPKRKNKIVTFEDPQKPVAKQPKPVATHAAVENYKDLMVILRDEAERNPKSGYTSIGLVRNYLTLDTKLTQQIEIAEHGDQKTAYRAWKTMYKNYQTLMKPLLMSMGLNWSMDKPKVNQIVGDNAARALEAMHKSIINAQVTRQFKIPSRNDWDALWEQYYGSPGLERSSAAPVSSEPPTQVLRKYRKPRRLVDSPKRKKPKPRVDKLPVIHEKATKPKPPRPKKRKRIPREYASSSPSEERRPRKKQTLSPSVFYRTLTCCRR